MQYLFNYFWLLALLLNMINVGLFRVRANKIIRQNPEMAAGYQRVLLGYLIIGSLPWLMMGLGLLSGQVTNIFAYVNPHGGNGYVLLYHALLLFLLLLGFIWIFFRHGAEFWAKYMAPLNLRSATSPTGVKVQFGLALLAGLVGEIILWQQQLPFSSAFLSPIK
jgi:hypothetical protein